MDEAPRGALRSAPMTDAATARKLDLRGLKCPLPALRARKALRESAPGAELLVECTDPLAAIDIPNLVRETGDVLLGQSVAAGLATFHIRKAPP
jgi:tRNA 2-thiouridine synthesizing protein A